ICETGAASSIWPIRSRRTLALVTSTPQRSQTTPLYLTRLYFPQWHSQSFVGPKIRSQTKPSFSGFKVRSLIVSGFFTSPYDQERISSDEAKPILMYSKLLTSSKGLPPFQCPLLHLYHPDSTEMKASELPGYTAAPFKQCSLEHALALFNF